MKDASIIFQDVSVVHAVAVIPSTDCIPPLPIEYIVCVWAFPLEHVVLVSTTPDRSSPESDMDSAIAKYNFVYEKSKFKW
jgi:hypothetical protein